MAEQKASANGNGYSRERLAVFGGRCSGAEKLSKGIHWGQRTHFGLDWLNSQQGLQTRSGRDAGKQMDIVREAISCAGEPPQRVGVSGKNGTEIDKIGVRHRGAEGGMGSGGGGRSNGALRRFR